MTLKERFDSFDNEFLKFDRIANKRSKRPDMHAFLLLDELFPDPDQHMIPAACHDQIFLGIDEEECETLSDDHILELVRCGVFLDSEFGSLSMWA